ncbi:MAG: xanthine dehydrogenase family protein subunit M [Acidimicrobiia bacterium]
MKPAPFGYERPGSVDEAVSILADVGYGAKILSGGQSLVPLLNLRLAFPEVLVDVTRIPDLGYVAEDGETVRVGALVTQAEFGASGLAMTRVPIATQVIPHIGHFVTRNQGTVAGSLAHADSRGELPVALTALEGAVTVASSRGRREISADEFFISDFTTSMTDDEMLVESAWPAAKPGWGFAFSEFALRHGDYALVMIAVTLYVSEGVVQQARVVAGSVAPRPLVLAEMSEILIGRAVDESAVAACRAASVSAVSPDADIHASSEYKRHLTGVLVEKTIRSAWLNATGDAHA